MLTFSINKKTSSILTIKVNDEDSDCVKAIKNRIAKDIYNANYDNQVKSNLATLLLVKDGFFKERNNASFTKIGLKDNTLEQEAFINGQFVKPDKRLVSLDKDDKLKEQSFFRCDDNLTVEAIDESIDYKWCLNELHRLLEDYIVVTGTDLLVLIEKVHILNKECVTITQNMRCKFTPLWAFRGSLPEELQVMWTKMLCDKDYFLGVKKDLLDLYSTIDYEVTPDDIHNNLKDKLNKFNIVYLDFINYLKRVYGDVKFFNGLITNIPYTEMLQDVQKIASKVYLYSYLVMSYKVTKLLVSPKKNNLPDVSKILSHVLLGEESILLGVLSEHILAIEKEKKEKDELLNYNRLLIEHHEAENIYLARYYN